MDSIKKGLQTVSVESSVCPSRSSNRQDKKCYHLTPKVIKHSGMAICKFVQSTSASRYLRDLTQKENIELEGFMEYFVRASQFFEESGNFHTLLVIQMTDDKTIQAYKRVIKQVSEIFIKYHSLEWISKRKSLEKETLLKCRLKMLNAVRSS